MAKQKESNGKRRRIQFGRMQWAMALFGIMIVVLLAERHNVGYEKPQRSLELLDNSVFSKEPLKKEAECLLLWDSALPDSEAARTEMGAVLDQMKIEFTDADMQREKLSGLSRYRNVILAVEQFSVFGEQILDIFDYVKEGGNLLIISPPEQDGFFGIVKDKMGIREVGNKRYRVEGLRFKTGFMLGGQAEDYTVSDPFESALTASLDETCRVHLVSADDKEVPLIWERRHGEGRIVVANLNYFEKVYRGFYASAYSLLDDVCVWPVINGSTFYIDDFPSPVPGGEGEYIRRDYNMDIRDFYTNVWWPDVEEMGQKHGIRYTGLVIENYSDENSAPFEGNDDIQRFRYFGNKLLDDGGEIGYHGYNHMPLVLDNFDYKGQFESYKQWKSREDMRLAIEELDRFCAWLFPKERFQVYVPPSNILSAEGREMLAEDFPQVKAIAGIYFQGEFEYVQDFTVAEDGMIETPRVVSGYMLSDYMRVAALSELNFHFVNSHFQHPDDVLDVERGGDNGWEVLKNRLAGYMDWLYGAAPDIRNLTGTEFAGAVQRYYFLEPETERTDDGVRISLNNFQDEAWLFVRVNEGAVRETVGGKLTPLTDGLYLLKAEQKEVTLKLGSAVANAGG